MTRDESRTRALLADFMREVGEIAETMAAALNASGEVTPRDFGLAMDRIHADLHRARGEAFALLSRWQEERVCTCPCHANGHPCLMCAEMECVATPPRPDWRSP